ncbi:MAG TPA: helix-turn-helix domain-containing protein [Bryobacteraceae bacterium]
MATVSFVRGLAQHRRISLAEIDAVVSARLGATRGLGNSQPACFNRQVAMYLVKRVGGWTTTVIGRFYNGRDRSTVCHGIQRVEALRESDPDVDSLISDLKHRLSGQSDLSHEAKVPATFPKSASVVQLNLDQLAELVAARVCAYIDERMHRSETD